MSLIIRTHVFEIYQRLDNFCHVYAVGVVGSPCGLVCTNHLDCVHTMFDENESKIWMCAR